MSLASALERAAEALPEQAAAIRPANGDPARVLSALEPETAAQVLDWLLREEADAGEELALAWAELPEGGPALARVDPGQLPKAGRKALRRALHRARSRGVEVPETSARPVVAKLPAVEDKRSEALVTAVDPSGAQLLILAEPHPGGGVRLFEAVVDDERGVLEFHVGSTTRSEARRFLKELADSERVLATSAPPESLRPRLARIAERHPEERPLPSGFVDWRRRVAEPVEGDRTPGELARDALGGDEGGRGTERALELVEQGELGPWPPPPEVLRATAEKLHETAGSRIVVSDAQRREQRDEVYREALAARLAAGARGRDADRLEETAYVWWRHGREEDARACVRAAAELRDAQAVDHPLARALLERAVEPIVAALADQERSSLVVRP